MGTVGGAGSAGISDLADVAFANTSDGSIPAQQNNNQPTVETLLKSRVQDSAGWNSAHQAGFAGLPGGVPMVIGILMKLAEQITGIPVTQWVTMWTENPIIETISTIAQDALASIWTVLANIQSLWSGIDFTSLSFDPAAAWAFLSELVPDWLEDMIFGNEGTEFPMTFPHGFAAPATLVTQFFYIIRQFTGIDDFEDLFSPTILLDVIINFIEAILKPQELLAHLVGGVLPDFQAPQLLHDIIDAIVNAFRLIPIVGPGIADLVSTILAMVGFTGEAQDTGNANSGEILAIKAALAAAGSGGVVITDDFDRAVNTTLGSGYVQTYYDAGAGTEGLDGLGNAHWSNAGSVGRGVINRNITPLSTQRQYVSFVMNSQVGAHWTVPSARFLMLRCNQAGTRFVYVVIYRSQAILYSYNAGVDTTLASSATLALKAGDFWELFAGDGVTDYRFIVKVNGVTVIDHNDTGHVSLVSTTPVTGTWYPGFGGYAGNYLTSFITYAQLPPPDIAAFGAADII